MDNFCLIPSQIDSFKKALKDRELDITTLLDPALTSEQRAEMFKPYAGDNAHNVNLLFEKKMVLKNKTLGLQNLMAKLGKFGKYAPDAQAQAKAALEDFKAKQQQQILSPKEEEAFLNDLADKVVGIHVSQEVASKVFDLTKKAAALKDTNQKMSGFSDEYLMAKTELNQYIENQQPLSARQSIGRNLAVIGRNNLLMNPATPIKAISGQVVNGAMEFATRRLGTMSLTGFSGDLAKQANKEAWQTFRKTGLDTTSMESVDDAHTMVKGENFRTAASANARGLTKAAVGTVRFTAKVSNKIAIDWEHNLAFTKFHQKTFFDMANILATKFAKTEGLTGEALKTRANDIFTDSAKIKPETAAGAMVRLESQKQAARVTSTNPNFLAALSGGVKARFPLGTLIIPIAKIPATIVANGIDNAGAGLPFGVKDIYQGFQKIQSPIPETKYEGMAQMSGGIQHVARVVGVLGLAAYLASQYKKDDFKTDKYGASFFKVGNTWISTAYISAISPAWAGMMEAKAKGSTGGQALEDYGHGVLKSLTTVPGLDEVNALLADLTSTNYVAGLTKYITNFFTSRGEPAFFANLMKDRPIQRLFFGATGVETDTQASQDASAARSKSGSWSVNPGPELQQFKAFIGDKGFGQANDAYNKAKQDKLNQRLNDATYKAMSPKAKQQQTQKDDTVIRNQIFKQNGFKYKPQKSATKTLKSF